MSNILLGLEEWLHSKLKDIKELEGIAVTDQIRKYIVKGLLSDGYTTMKELKEIMDGNTKY